MSFLSSLTARLPFSKKSETPEPFFALYIGAEKLSTALWVVEGGKLKILDTAADSYSGEENIIKVTDRLLDAVVGERDLDVQKILFGVPDWWLSDENLKENYLKLLRKLVKELELKPMAYVSSSNALVHFLENQEGVPTTAILVGLEEKHLNVTVTKAGKTDGTKQVLRTDDLGLDIEKALLTFTNVEVLPSKILIYGFDIDVLEKVKAQLLSFSWMSKLSFLHFPKIECLTPDVATIGICFAGAFEIDNSVSYSATDHNKKHLARKADLLVEPESESEHAVSEKQDFGFVVGDVSANSNQKTETEEDYAGSVEDFENMPVVTSPKGIEHNAQQNMVYHSGKKMHFPRLTSLGFLKEAILKKRGSMLVLIGVVGISLLIVAYLFLLKANIKIYVEPKILEKDTQVIADPTIITVQEDEKKIPGKIVETEVTGSGKGVATGKKQVGDPAKGTVKIINNTNQEQSFSKGTVLTSSNGLKFTLDLAINIASTSAFADSKSIKTVPVTASEIGADSNLPTGYKFTIAGASFDDVAIVSEGNFSGGTSKDVIVISDSDQQKLIAQVASELRKQAQQKLQEKLPDKKVLEETLSETLIKKSFNKNINDQASEFTLNLTARYKGTAYDDKDLRVIVSKLVNIETSPGFSLDLADTETQADVSKVEKDGRVVFLARFKAKLIPKLNTAEILKQIRGKSEKGAIDFMKGLENVLDAEIVLKPNLPGILRRVPLLKKNVNIEVGLK